MAVLKIMIVSTQKANDASDRAHDGRHRLRGTQISPLKLAAILMDSSLPLTQWDRKQKYK